MKRIEINSTTGELVEIEQSAYKTAQNEPVVLDAGQPSDGLTSISWEEVKELTAPNPLIAMTAIKTQFRKDREAYLTRLAGMGVAANFEGRADLVECIVEVRQGLLDLPAVPAVVAADSIATLEAAMKTAYDAILIAIPSNLRVELSGAFKKVDA